MLELDTMITINKNYDRPVTLDKVERWKIIVGVMDNYIFSKEHTNERIRGWDSNEFARNPKPHFKSERGYLHGKRWELDNQPTHWMPLPKHPTQEK